MPFQRIIIFTSLILFVVLGLFTIQTNSLKAACDASEWTCEFRALSSGMTEIFNEDGSLCCAESTFVWEQCSLNDEYYQSDMPLCCTCQQGRVCVDKCYIDYPGGECGVSASCTARYCNTTSFLDGACPLVVDDGDGDEDPFYCDLSAAPDSGPKPLTVDFSVDVYSADVVSYWEIDWEGDSSYDYRVEGEERPTSESIPNHGYPAEGNYWPTLRLVSTLDEEMTCQAFVEVTGPPPYSCTLECDPTSGEVPVAVSYTPNIINGVGTDTWSIDYENDGTPDQSGVGAPGVGTIPNHTYTTPGTYESRLTIVRDAESADCSCTVTAEAPPNNPPTPTLQPRSSFQAPDTLTRRKTKLIGSGYKVNPEDYVAFRRPRPASEPDPKLSSSIQKILGSILAAFKRMLGRE